MSTLTPRQRRRLELLVDEVALPSVWFNPSTKAPFTHCSMSGTKIEDHTDHLIELMVENGKVRYAFALDMNTVQQMQSQLSIGSRQTVRDWFDTHTEMGQRINALATREERHPDSWIEHCICTGIPRELLDSYHLVAHARGSNLVTGAMPYAISGSAITELQEALSEDTREYNARFLEQQLGAPPEEATLAASTTLLV